MFGGLRNLAGIAGMMSQAGDLQGKIAAAKEQISGLRVEGTAGGDAVTVRMTGDFMVISISIHSWLIETRDQQMMEQLTTAAMNEAIQKAKEAAASLIGQIADEMNIPGLRDALSRMPG